MSMVPPVKYLIVDDVEENRLSLSALLARDGLEILQAGSGREALEHLLVHEFALAILDVQMPEMDGFELAELMRGTERTRRVPIIFLTAGAHDEQRRFLGYEAGAVDFLFKPVEPDILRSKASVFFDLCRQRQDLARHGDELQAAAETNARLANEARLKAHELELLMQVVPVGIWIARDRECTDVYLNRAAQSFYDQHHDEPKVDPASLELDFDCRLRRFFTLSGRELPPEDQPLQRAIRTGEEVVDEELVVLLPSGRRRIIFGSATPLRDGEGRVCGALGAFMDITRRLAAEEEIRRLNETLEASIAERTAQLLASNEQLQGFTYSVAHDFRQHIRGINSNASIVLADLIDDPGEFRSNLERIVSLAHTMSRMTDDLLTNARLRREALKIETVDLSSLAEEVGAHCLGSSSPYRSAELHVQSGLQARGDRTMLRLVLENLLENAFKYSSKSEKPSVLFGRDEEGFFVRDNGAGFDMAHAGKLFQPFERLHRASEYPGSGIGLANVQRVVERHLGRVWAVGAPGEGACFWFTLNLADDSHNFDDADASDLKRTARATEVELPTSEGAASSASLN
jgi:signal transduction histidine kinase/DNA-binding response OmpR family regulator